MIRERNTNGYLNYVRMNGAISNGYLYNPNYGPYDSSNYPSIETNLNNGVLRGIMPNPSKFHMDAAGEFARARKTYIRSVPPIQTPPQEVPPKICVSGLGRPERRFFSGMYVSQITSNSKNYIAPISSSQNTQMTKIENIGKSSLKQGLPVDAALSFKCPDNNFTRSKLRRVRSGGCVAPKKCSSIYHYQFTPVLVQNSF